MPDSDSVANSADSAHVEQKSQPQAKRKRPWLAALLSLIWPGLGQLYAGRPLRGFIISLIFPAVATIVFRFKLLQIPVGLFLWIALSIIALIVIAVDAAVLTSRQNVSRVSTPGWSPTKIVTAVLIVAVNSFPPHRGLPASSKGFKVPSASMCPTICEHERIVADMEAYKNKLPRPGDVIMLQPRQETAPYIKRVIAVGGDVVEQGKQGEILVNGRPLPPLAVCSKPPAQASEGLNINFDRVTVPAGLFFVVGDNLTNSFDSRLPEFGFVSADQLRGKPLYLYWSPVFARIGCKIY